MLQTTSPSHGHVESNGTSELRLTHLFNRDLERKAKGKVKAKAKVRAVNGRRVSDVGGQPDSK